MQHARIKGAVLFGYPYPVDHRPLHLPVELTFGSSLLLGDLTVSLVEYQIISGEGLSELSELSFCSTAFSVFITSQHRIPLYMPPCCLYPLSLSGRPPYVTRCTRHESRSQFRRLSIATILRNSASISKMALRALLTPKRPTRHPPRAPVRMKSQHNGFLRHKT